MGKTTRRLAAGVTATALIAVGACAATEATLKSWIKGDWQCESKVAGRDGSDSFVVKVDDSTWTLTEDVLDETPWALNGGWKIQFGDLTITVDGDWGETWVAGGVGSPEDDAPTSRSALLTWSGAWSDGNSETGNLDVSIEGSDVRFILDSGGSFTTTLCTKA